MGSIVGSDVGRAWGGEPLGFQLEYISPEREMSRWSSDKSILRAFCCVGNASADNQERKRYHRLQQKHDKDVTVRTRNTEDKEPECGANTRKMGTGVFPTE